MKKEIEEKLAEDIAEVNDSDLTEKKKSKAIAKLNEKALEAMAAIPDEEDDDAFEEAETVVVKRQKGAFCMIHHEGKKQILQNNKVYDAETKELVADLNKKK